MEKYFESGIRDTQKGAFLSDFCRHWSFTIAALAGFAAGTVSRTAGAQTEIDNRPASAVTQTDTTADPDLEAPAAHKKKGRKQKDGEKKKPKRHAIVSPAGRAEIKGRLIARSEWHAQRRNVVDLDGNLQRGLIKSFDLSVPSARISLHYESPVPWLTGVVEFELASRPLLKDGYAQARLGGFQLRAGQFKMPTAPHESVSPVVLPTVHRGFLSSLLTDWLDVGGRRPGVMLSYHSRWPLRPSLSIGAFQGSTASEIILGRRDTDLIEGRTNGAQSFVARAQIETKALEVGAWYEHRLGSPAINVGKRYFTAGADVTWDEGDHGSGLRAWLSGIVGQSWYRHPASNPSSDPETTFATGRLLVGYRLFGKAREAFYFEPFGLCGVFDPDLKLTHDFALETAVGMNIGLWRRARITLQLESVLNDTYFPKSSEGFLAGEEPRRESAFAQVTLLF
jgi:hypothetical protein